MNPVDQVKILLRALRRIGDKHSTDGAIARLAVLEATGKHPWGEDAAEDAARFGGHNLKITAESRLEKLSEDLWKHQISFADSRPIKTKNNELNMGRSAESILGRLVMEALGWKDQCKDCNRLLTDRPNRSPCKERGKHGGSY